MHLVRRASLVWIGAVRVAGGMRAFLGLGGLFPVSRVMGHGGIRARAIGLIGNDLALWMAVPVACARR